MIEKVVSVELFLGSVEYDEGPDNRTCEKIWSLYESPQTNWFCWWVKAADERSQCCTN